MENVTQEKNRCFASALYTLRKEIDILWEFNEIDE